MRGGQRAHRDQEPDRALVAGQRVDRREDHREADRVNRIDLAVGAARQVVRLEIGRGSTRDSRRARGCSRSSDRHRATGFAPSRGSAARRRTERATCPSASAPRSRRPPPWRRRSRRRCVVRLHRSIARAVINRDCHNVHTCSAATDSQTIAPSGPASACSTGHRSGMIGRNGTSSTINANIGRTSSPQPRPLERSSSPRGALR